MNEKETKCRKCGKSIDTKKVSSYYILKYLDGLERFYCNDKCILAQSNDIQGLLQ